MVNQDKPI